MCGLGVTKQTAVIKYYESNDEDGVPRNFVQRDSAEGKFRIFWYSGDVEDSGD